MPIDFYRLQPGLGPLMELQVLPLVLEGHSALQIPIKVLYYQGNIHQDFNC